METSFMKVAEILKTEGILKTTKDETLGTVLNNLSSSHDAAFVFEDEEFKRYLGVVNPYYAVIKGNYPPETKVENLIFHAPKLKLDDDLSRAAQLMSESKVHYLPVLDNKGEKFLGIATARRILRKLITTERLRKGVQEILPLKRPLITIGEEESIFEALKKFREEKVSKLVVVDSHGHLRGILAYFDLIPLSLFPKERASFGDKAGDKASYLKTAKVKNLMKTYVLTLPLTATLKQAAQFILDREIGSVVILGADKKPVSIITTRDLLTYGFVRERSVENLSEVEIKNVKEKHLPFIKTFVEKLLAKAEKRKATVRIFFEEEKGGGVIKAKIQIDVKGKTLYFSHEDKNLKRLLEKLDRAVEEEI